MIEMKGKPTPPRRERLWRKVLKELTSAHLEVLNEAKGDAQVSRKQNHELSVITEMSDALNDSGVIRSPVYKDDWENSAENINRFHDENNLDFQSDGPIKSNDLGWPTPATVPKQLTERTKIAQRPSNDKLTELLDTSAQEDYPFVVDSEEVEGGPRNESPIEACADDGSQDPDNHVMESGTASSQSSSRRPSNQFVSKPGPLHRQSSADVLSTQKSIDKLNAKASKSMPRTRSFSSATSGEFYHNRENKSELSSSFETALKILGASSHDNSNPPNANDSEYFSNLIHGE